jgi:hypothetical protein
VTFAGRTRDQRFLPYLEDFQTWDLGDDDVRGVKKAIARIKTLNKALGKRDS